MGAHPTLQERLGYPKGKITSEGRLPMLMRKYPNLLGDLSAGSGCNALMRDREYAAQLLNPGARSVICGGTTAEIVGRELGRPLTMSLAHLDPGMPATSEMEGAALVTEGCITLSAAADMLQSGEVPPGANGATRRRAARAGRHSRA